MSADDSIGRLPMPDQPAAQATTPAYIASAYHVHEATVRGGLWTARCDWSAGWSVPLIADPEAAVVFVSCPKCREMREAAQPSGSDVRPEATNDH